MHGFVGLAVGHVSVASVVVVGRGVDAAVVRPPLVEKVGFWVSCVAEATHASSLSSGSSVEPALVAVVAGGVTGKSVTAGVAGVLSLTLRRTRGRHSDRLRSVTDEQMRRGDDESDL